MAGFGYNKIRCVLTDNTAKERKMTKRLHALLAGTLMLSVFLAPVTAAESDPAETGLDLNFVIATTMEAKVKLTGTVTVPFLAGSGPLTSGNSVEFKLGGELSPVSVNGTFETVLTPVAFLQFLAGGSIGSGWNIPIANGLRMNERSGTNDAELTGGAFSGLVWSAKAGGLFQFDLAALKPGEWNHVVFQTMHVGKYRALSSAGSADSWLYEADTGENRNGWNYYGNYFLGYRMPLFLNTAGFLLEEDLYLFGTKDRSLWGDDLPRWTFGPLLNFTLGERTSAALLVQWQGRRNFNDETEDYGFYQDRRMTDDDRYHIEFYRAALSVTVKIK